jgi:hypothetical protein
MMEGALILTSLIALVSSVVVLLDWFGRRKDRRSKQTRAHNREV